MKKLSFIFLIILGFNQVNGQNIRPKLAYQRLYIGMKSEVLIELLGSPSKFYSQEEEKIEWEKAGYDIQKKVIFYLDFDYVYIYSYRNDFGIWKAYMRSGEIVYLSITSYNTSNEKLNSISIDEEIKFGDSMEQVKKHFGENYYLNIDEHEYTEIIYFNEGIRFIFINKELQHVYIFSPLPKSEEKVIIDHFKS